jgi:hypothetical protein
MTVSQQNAVVQNAIAMRQAIDQIEEAYEFMLAYAAQGKKREEEGEDISKIRQYLSRFARSLESMRGVAPTLLPSPASAPFRDRVLADLAVTVSVLALLLEQRSITSDLVDNTNGLIAMCSLRTDLFFIDQAVLPPR